MKYWCLVLSNRHREEGWLIRWVHPSYCLPWGRWSTGARARAWRDRWLWIDFIIGNGWIRWQVHPPIWFGYRRILWWKFIYGQWLLVVSGKMDRRWSTKEVWVIKRLNKRMSTYSRSPDSKSKKSPRALPLLATRRDLRRCCMAISLVRAVWIDSDVALRVCDMA